ncbi:hypothetical protein T4E_840 [Trichinella pseudospiralis]|uniref:Uncharacterized protein n=1 Tax=Trichinella pseudospiralis TaxID=6337 RepID=A0A0V0XPH2_TRIPS|nr:hypothetical protein T4E_840 [Trichinella pseudospiralis]
MMHKYIKRYLLSQVGMLFQVYVRMRRESQHSGTFYYAIATLADATHDVGNITQTLVHLQTPWSPYKDPLEVEALVRKAKAEMKTISVTNDCLFVDYRFVCHLPPNAKIRAS